MAGRLSHAWNGYLALRLLLIGGGSVGRPFAVGFGPFRNIFGPRWLTRSIHVRDCALLAGHDSRGVRGDAVVRELAALRSAASNTTPCVAA